MDEILSVVTEAVKGERYLITITDGKSKSKIIKKNMDNRECFKLLNLLKKTLSFEEKLQ